MKIEKIGLVGVGLMGYGIAFNLLKHGWDLSFQNHEGNQPTDDLVESGAQAFDSISEFASNCDVVILCVPGASQVEELIYGKTQLLEAMKPASILIDCSTSLPNLSKAVAQAAIEKNIFFLDAPMTRTAKDARAGRLNLLIGGDAETYNNCIKLLECFSENRTYVGPVGSGHTMKLLHNYVSLGFATILAEAAACAQSSEVSSKVFVNVLESGGGKSVVLDRLMPMILEDDPMGLEFSIGNAAKDLNYYCQMTEALNCEMRGAKGISDLLRTTTSRGNGDEYVPRLIEFFRSDKNFEI